MIDPVLKVVHGGSSRMDMEKAFGEFVGYSHRKHHKQGKHR